MAGVAAATVLATELAAATAELATAGIPAYPGGVEDNFIHNLEHIIGLDTAAQRAKITVNAGIVTIHDLLWIDEDAIIDSFTNTTSAMCKTRMRTLKRWTQDRHDDRDPIDIILLGL